MSSGETGAGGGGGGEKPAETRDIGVDCHARSPGSERWGEARCLALVTQIPSGARRFRREITEVLLEGLTSHC